MKNSRSLWSCLLIQERPDDGPSLSVYSQELGLAPGEHPRSFPELPIHDLFTVPVKGVEQGSLFPPDRGTVELPVFAQDFSHETAGSPESPEIFREFSVFWVVTVQAHFPVFWPDLFSAFSARLLRLGLRVQGDEFAHVYFVIRAGSSKILTTCFIAISEIFSEIRGL